MGFGVLDDGTLLAAVLLADATQVRIYRAHYDETKRECSWEDNWKALPSLLPGHSFASSSVGRFQDLGGGHVLFPLTAHEEAANGGLSYGLLYETTDGLSWVKRGMIGRFRSDIDVLPLESTDAAARSSLIATARYQTTSGSSKQITLPLYKQSIVQHSSDSGFSWSAPRLVTGYLQHSPSIVKLSDGTLVLPFSHQPPVTQQRVKGGGYWQRFIVSFTNGTTWSNRIFSLHTGECQQTRSLRKMMQLHDTFICRATHCRG